MPFLSARLFCAALFAILLMVLPRPAAAQAAALRVQHLRCEYQEAPLGIETPRPHPNIKD